MKQRRPALFLCICAICLLAACDSELGKTFSSMFEVQEAIGKIAGTSSIGVSIVNNENMSVRINNSPLNDSDSATRRDAAREMAIEAIRVYEYGDAIKTIAVVYVLVDTKFFVLSTSKIVDQFSFDASELKPMSPENALRTGHLEFTALALGGYRASC